MIIKCRPTAEWCNIDDPSNVEEVIVPDYEAAGGFTHRRAAEKFAEQWCHNAVYFGELDVQVLTEKGWETFEITIESVPMFHASRKKGVEPVPDTFRCNDCDVRKVKTELASTVVDICAECYAKEVAEDEE